MVGFEARPIKRLPWVLAGAVGGLVIWQFSVPQIEGSLFVEEPKEAWQMVADESDSTKIGLLMLAIISGGLLGALFGLSTLGLTGCFRRPSVSPPDEAWRIASRFINEPRAAGARGAGITDSTPPSL
jgi:hypothetical protein